MLHGALMGISGSGKSTLFQLMTVVGEGDQASNPCLTASSSASTPEGP